MKTKTKSDVRTPARKTRSMVRRVKSEPEAEDFVPAPVAAEPAETAPTESAHGDHLP